MRIGASFVMISLGVLLSACMGTPGVVKTGVPGFETVMGKEWHLVELRGGTGIGFSRDPIDPEFTGVYTLEFQDGMVFGRGAPNIFRASFEQGRDQSLGIKPGATTLMAPFREPEGLTERDYFGYLERVYRWNISDGALELYTKNDRGEDAVLVYRLPGS